MIRAAKYDDRRPVLNGNSPTRTLGWSKNLSLPSLSTPAHRYLSCIASSSSHPLLKEKCFPFFETFLSKTKESSGRALFVISWRCKNPRNSSTPSPKWNFARENLIYDRRNTLLPRSLPLFLSAIVKYSISKRGISWKGSKRWILKGLARCFQSVWCDIRFGLLNFFHSNIYLFVKRIIYYVCWNWSVFVRGNF